MHRDPTAVLATILDGFDAAPGRSALAVAAESVDDAESVRTAASASNSAATERTATWLDQLTASGVLSRAQRAQLAAEDGAANLTRILRRAELAGHDPRRVLLDAVADRPLDGARNAGNVIYSRIREAHRFDPLGESWHAWIPSIQDAAWREYLCALASAADRRAAELATQVAADRPAWAVEAFGPPPEDVTGLRAWEAKAGTVAAYRELRGHDDPVEALGAAPAAGQGRATRPRRRRRPRPARPPAGDLLRRRP